VLNARVFLPRQRAAKRAAAAARPRGRAVRAGAWARWRTALLVAAIVVGSRNLQNFDPRWSSTPSP
jgi:MFS transporter, NNP family, nitrate/nitrite transporter